MPRLLNTRQSRFVQEYLVDLNATQAAIRAGYSVKTARSQGQRLLTNVDIHRAIQTVGMAIKARLEISAERTLNELARIGFSDLVDMLNEDGKLKPVSEWPQDTRRAVASIKTRRVIEGKGEDAHEVEVVEIKFWDKVAALDKLARHHSLYAGEQPTVVNTYNRMQVTNDQVRTDLAKLLSDAISRTTAKGPHGEN